MSADLTVRSIRLPSPLRAPCPSVILVEVENIGNDPADPAPWDVTIDIFSGETLLDRFEAEVTTPEGQRLFPGSTITVAVTVQFPCVSPVDLEVTVDLRQQVSNNQRSAPSVRRPGLTPTAAPWLVTTLSVSMANAAGVHTLDPVALCPGKMVTARVTIQNEGCATSQPCTVEVALEDPRIGPVPTTLTTIAYQAPALPPGSNDVQVINLPTPRSAAGTSGFLNIRATADAKFENPDQCDRRTLQQLITKPFGAGAAPRPELEFRGGNSIRPGQVPALTWRLHNDCTEIGTAEVRIRFGTARTDLLVPRRQFMIRLRSTIGQDLLPSHLTIPLPTVTVPSPLAAEFWAIGTKTIELEVVGDGPEPGPYRISVPFTVLPEPIDATWWTWSPIPTAFWKTGYTVTGTFTNRSLAGMSLSALTALEHPTDVVGTAQDRSIAPSQRVPTISFGAGASAVFTWSRFQSWTWLAAPTFFEVGPRARAFTYTANFAITDDFGNSYTSAASMSITVPVSVDSGKIFYFESGTTLVTIGMGVLALAVVLLIQGWPSVIGAAIAAGIAMVFIILGMLFLYAANDPPIPDFREGDRQLVDPRLWTIPEMEDEKFHALRTLALILARLVSARVRALHYRDRAWAAFLDGDDATLTRFRTGARRELETLRRLVRACVDTADEAHEEFEEILSHVESPPSLEELRTSTDRFADELHLSERERKLVYERLDSVDAEQLHYSYEYARREGLRAVGVTVRSIYERTAAELAQAEYLR